MRKLLKDTGQPLLAEHNVMYGHLGHLDSEHQGERQRGDNQQHREQREEQRAHTHTALTSWWDKSIQRIYDWTLDSQ